MRRNDISISWENLKINNNCKYLSTNYWQSIGFERGSFLEVMLFKQYKKISISLCKSLLAGKHTFLWKAWK